MVASGKISGSTSHKTGGAWTMDRIVVARLLAQALLHVLHCEKEKAMSVLQLVLSALMEEGDLI
jgi:hypothetical protein